MEQETVSAQFRGEHEVVGGADTTATLKVWLEDEVQRRWSH
jgi:hypothetical protein